MSIRTAFVTRQRACLGSWGFLKGVNWYTLLGDLFVERLGGDEQLRKALHRDDIRIERINHCVLVRAGPFPRLGAPEEALPEPYVFVQRGAARAAQSEAGWAAPIRPASPECRQQTCAVLGGPFRSTGCAAAPPNRQKWYRLTSASFTRAYVAAVLARQPAGGTRTRCKTAGDISSREKSCPSSKAVHGAGRIGSGSTVKTAAVDVERVAGKARRPPAIGEKPL